MWFVTELQILAYFGSGAGCAAARVRGGVFGRTVQLLHTSSRPLRRAVRGTRRSSWRAMRLWSGRSYAIHYSPTTQQHRALMRNEAMLSKINYSTRQATCGASPRACQGCSRLVAATLQLVHKEVLFPADDVHIGVAIARTARRAGSLPMSVRQRTGSPRKEI